MKRSFDGDKCWLMKSAHYVSLLLNVPELYLAFGTLLHLTRMVLYRLACVVI